MYFYHTMYAHSVKCINDRYRYHRNQLYDDYHWFYVWCASKFSLACLGKISPGEVNWSTSSLSNYRKSKVACELDATVYDASMLN